jgi:radical SAM superfamily enzyme YgiQ (UPF0313 family)
MSRRLYLINPASDFPNYFGRESFAASGLAPACLVADLATTSVAAMASKHLDVRICEENIEPIDYDTGADFVGITGKLTQTAQMLRIAAAFRARGKTVIIGGPFASLSPGAVRDGCDILFRGEMEGIADEFFSDLAEGTWKAEYDGGRPDLTTSPAPRWDLYPNERTLMGALQTSRGCPFDCEFCDVIQYLGRNQRFKNIDQILAELDVLNRSGYQRIFLSDDNFTVNRNRAKSVLEALRHWNDSRGELSPCTFDTQASIEAGEDDELLHLCVEGGLTSMFIGIETPNADSLRETRKFQNLRKPIVESIKKIVEHGVSVRGGMIVGFDSDGPDMFQRMFDFAMETPIPFYSLNPLIAPAATPLHARLKREGRLRSEAHEMGHEMPMDTNIIPKQMSREELLRGVKWLGNQLYRPAAFLHRLKLFASSCGVSRRNPPAPRKRHAIRHSVYQDAMKLVKYLRSLGPEEDQMIRDIFQSLSPGPDANSGVMESLIGYAQVRHVYSQGRFWDDRLPDRYEGAAPLSVPAR